MVFCLKQSIFGGIFSGAVGGTIASLCCVGPIILTLLGLGVLFGLIGICLADYRLPFFAIALVFIVLSGFLHFRRGPKVCGVSFKHKCTFALTALIAMAVIYLLLMWLLLPFLLSLNHIPVCSI